jgi:phage tail-like protein
MDVNGLRFWMLSQLNDWLPPWRADTVYLAGQGIVDPNGNIQIVQTPGASDAAQPGWQTGISKSTTDGTVAWINSGPRAWQPNTTYAPGQRILDANRNLQCVANITGTGSSGGAQPIWPQALNQTVVDENVTWICTGPSQAGLFYCNQTNRLQLRSMRTGSPPTEDFNTATSMVEAVPIALDTFGNYARWDRSSGLIVASGGGPSNAPPPDEVPIFGPPQPSVTDLVLGYDGILYIAVGGSLIMVDRRSRWPDYTLTVPNFNFWRLTALPEGGILALDPDKPQLGIVSGQPLQTGPVDVPTPGILRSCDPNPNPPRIVSLIPLPPAPERFVALAPMDLTQQPAQFLLLSWASNSAQNQTANIRIFSEPTNLGSPLQLAGVRLPYTIAWLGNQKLAAFATNLNEALIYEALIYDLSNAGDILVPAGETYVLPANNVGPFVHGFGLPPDYANAPGVTPLILPLLPLSLNSLAASGATNPSSPAIVDSGASQTTWHRVFLEAILPPRCGALIWLSTADTLADLYDPSCPWYPHTFGAVDTVSIPVSMLRDTPSGVWQSIPSEIPFGPTLLQEAPVQNTQGLFMALIQRAHKAVRNLSGRYLGVRIQLNGDGRNTPEIAGLRVYGTRFSYVQNYLPEIYHESKFGPDADQDGKSTRPDFFERFVNLFESQFTQIEDRVANAYLLTRPESSPDASLDWLGAWIGIEPNGYPPDRRRARLEATPYLHRWRGTTKGITKALDVATNWMCSRGAIIVIESFRLRHLFATILGADLSIQHDPLLPGYSGSSNSIVGDTLFLGDPRIQAELQALYATTLNIPGGAQAAQSFYDQFANRITVFIHNQVEDVNLNLVQRIVEAEKPAHVQASIVLATQPLMIGLASLLGVNTYLAPEPPRNTATVNVSDVGHDVVTDMPSLDPRYENSE